MVRSLFTLAAVLGLTAAAAVPRDADKCVTIQYNFPSNTNQNDPRASAIAQEYRYVWNQYKQQAFGTDELLPISMKGENDLFGWGASIVDGIDTAVIMGLTDIVKEQLAFIAGFDFSKSNYIVDYFDAVIRYLGGLLSAYDIINSPLVPKGTYNQTQVNALLKAAVTIGDKLKPIFNTTTGLPVANVNFTSGQASNCNPLTPCTSKSIDTAQVGTMILEMYRLSDLTKDLSYRNLAAKAESYLISPNQQLLHPYLVGSSLDYTTGKFIDKAVGWQAGLDSFIEYLIKTYIYNPKGFNTTQYRDFWIGTVQSTMKYLALSPFQHPELTFITQADAQGNLMYSMDDYACFAGGNILLGGKYLSRTDFSGLGYRVADSCHALFNTSAAGLNPLQWSWFNSKNQTYSKTDGGNPANVAYAKKNGFFINSPFWGAFPEPVESMWYAYRITGETKWQDYVWQAFQSMLKDTKNRQKGVTFAQLNNVTQPLGGTLNDNVPSFFFAELLKYMYLTFTPPSVISLDQFVFNTEGHPLKIQSGTCATGS